VMAHMGGFPRLAVKPLEESRQLVQERFGPRHLYEALVLYQLGLALADAGDPDRAETTWRDCLVIVRDCGILAHPKSIILYHDLADLLRRRGKPVEAEAL